MTPGHRAISAALVVFAIALLLTVPVSAATTELRIVRYAADGFTILNETRVTYQWLEQNLPVQGDGKTHYYHQGPIFVDDADPVEEQELRWNPEEDTNVREKDMGAVKGTDLRDLCELAGGMHHEDEYLVVKAQDGFTKKFPYENVYYPQPRQGRIVVCWYNGGYETGGPAPGYVPAWSDGMRLIFFADTSTNPWGLNVFGNADARECLPEEYWHYYWQGTEKYPTTTGFTVQRVSEILIYTREEPSGSIRVTSTPAGATVLLDGDPTGCSTPCTLTDIEQGSHSVLVLLDGYQEPFEQMVSVMVNTESPVHFNLLPALPGEDGAQSGSSSGDSSGVQGPGGAGLGGELELYQGGPVAGRPMLIPGETDPVHLTGGDETLVAFHGLPASGLPVSLSRLFLYTSGEEYAGTGGTGDLLLTVTAGGDTFVEEAVYSDEGAKSLRSSTRCYNLSGFTLPEGDLTVRVQLDGPRGTHATLAGAALLLVYQEQDAIPHQSWIAEGCTYINVTKHLAEYGTDIPIVTSLFTGPLKSGVPEGASLHIIATGDPAGGSHILSTRFNHADPLLSQHGDSGSVRIQAYDLSGQKVPQSSIVTLVPGDELVRPESVTIRGIIYSERIHPADLPPDLQSHDACSLFPDWCEEGGELDIISPQGPAGSQTGQERGEDLLQELHPPERNGILELLKKTADEAIQVLFHLAFLLTGVDQDPGNVPERSADNGFLHRTGSSGKPVVHNLTILSSPAGAQVVLNGRDAPITTPCMLSGLPNGEYDIWLTKSGFLPNKTTIAFHRDETLEMVLWQEEGAARGTAGTTPDADTPSSLGGVYITLYPSEGDIYLDGKLLQSSAPVLVYGIRQGPHQVRVARTGTGSSLLPEITRLVWVHPGTITPVLINRYQDQLVHSVAISSPFYDGSTFSVNGMFPTLTLPAKVSLTGSDPYVTVRYGDTFLSFPIPARERALESFVITPPDRPLRSLEIQSVPDGAPVFIDGFPTGQVTPCIIPGISEGPHKVLVAKPGYLPVEQVIFIPVQDGEQGPFLVRTRLERYGHGALIVESDPPGCRVTLNGLATGERTPCLIPYLPIGIIEVTCTGSGGSRSGDVQILPFRTQTYRAFMNR